MAWTWVDRRATFTLRMGAKKTGFVDTDAGRRMLQSLQMEDLTEDRRTMRGQLWVLPHNRQFELKVEDRVIKGRLGRDIKDPSSLLAGAQVVVELRETRLRAARPRYTLLSVLPP